MSMEFYNHSTPISRKERECEMCGQKIMPGEQYSKEVGKYYGDFFSRILHLDCSEVLGDFLSEAEENEFCYSEIYRWWVETRCTECKHYYSQCDPTCKFHKGDPESCGDRRNGRCTSAEPCDEMNRSYWCDKYEKNKG